MSNVTFITGNQAKADYLAKYLGYPVQHHKLDLDELQSLELKPIVEHKLRQAYAIIGQPVIVEDVALEFAALGRLPGTFIKFFLTELPLATICHWLDGTNRAATARCMFGYYDGTTMQFFESALDGTIAPEPAGTGSFGFDKIFIPAGYTVPRAALSPADDMTTYLQIKPFAALKQFLQTTDRS